MSTSLESQILLAIWTMYQRNQVSMEQKGYIKDLLIRKDNNLYQTICNCLRQDQIEERLLEILNCIYFRFGLIRVHLETQMLKKIYIQFSDLAINQVLQPLLNPNVIIPRKDSDLRVQIMKVILLRIFREFDQTHSIINEIMKFLFDYLILKLNLVIYFQQQNIPI